ncbi:MAG: LL-diaminopimelate aminotransferase [Clostridia bacterium]|nr:LL-diaminopimelate aminotransferase [Clostridia bacterium]MBQ6383564.1 LL-diaminopimelate aminotransferase [Clostridia bacterium]
MLKPNGNYRNLKDSYLFFGISKKVEAYRKAHPDLPLYRLGIGDVSRPLCDEAIKALHAAVNDQADARTFRGYTPECGIPEFRQAAAGYYARRGVRLDPEEVFVSSGASDELGDILDLFDASSPALITQPAYPAYVDASVMAGRKVSFLNAGPENDFLPLPGEDTEADLIYLCSPNNPTGAVYSREQLQAWVDYANRRGAVILFDAAYEAFIEEDLPHSIFEIPGAENCAVEICSLSKTAGFTGTRLGYTVIPKALERDGMNLNAMWVRNRTTKTNGISYILQKAGIAVFSDAGLRQIQENIQIYKENARVLMRALDGAGIRYWGGKNAPYIWMACPDGMKSWDFFDLLLNEIQVIGTPGEGFGACGEGFFRLSSFGDPEDTRIAAERIRSLIVNR